MLLSIENEYSTVKLSSSHFIIIYILYSYQALKSIKISFRDQNENPNILQSAFDPPVLYLWVYSLKITISLLLVLLTVI